MPAKTIVLTLPPLAAYTLDRYAARVRLTPEELLLEALRCANWYRDSLARSFPIELLHAPEGERP
jgi:hypothetical protein